MSQVRDANFVVLTGHLNDYALADLISILRRQRKTGRLLIEYPISPCAFFFRQGDLVDAQLNTFVGLQAFMVALSQPNASFNFNPLIEASSRSINETSQKVILELLGCAEEKTIDVEPSSAEVEQAISTISAQVSPEPIEAEFEPVEHQEPSLPAGREVLALPPAPARQANSLRVVIISALVSLVVSMLTVAALTIWLGSRTTSNSSAQTAGATGTGRSAAQAGASNVLTVNVVLQVEGGRVTRAFVAEHRPGMEAYEAAALRAARARRYPPGVSGQDTVSVTVIAPQ
ncbi:MAG TPA: DUF4388 domain-containing protein [Pyrinomonadaceae bacterium]|nr:DUF4388 domain-containing protein [Pyrinomonadaceae bacterium]